MLLAHCFAYSIRSPTCDAIRAAQNSKLILKTLKNASQLALGDTPSKLILKKHVWANPPAAAKYFLKPLHSMSDPKIEPARITKPIQLLAAWLAGLVLVNGAFLTAASLIPNPSWAAGALVVAAVVNVPLFLICIFLLQTKFRPEMQEDEFYHKYLEKRYSSLTGKSEVIETKLIDAKTPSLDVSDEQSKLRFRRVRPLPSAAKESQDFRIRVNDLLPFFRPLLDDLVHAGLKPSDTFGSTSEDPTIPKPFVISIGENVPIEVVKKVLSVVQKYQPDGIAFTRDERGMHHKNIYIGAYSYEGNARAYLHLDRDNIQTLLAPEATQALWNSMIPLDPERDVYLE